MFTEQIRTYSAHRTLSTENMAAAYIHSSQESVSYGAQAMATYLDAGGLAVPRDLGVLPAEALRALVAAQTEPN